MNDTRNFTVNITPAIIVKTVAILILFYVLYLVRDLVLVVLTAVVIASSIEPITRWFRRVGIRRLPAVIIIYLISALVFAGLFYYFVPSLLSDSSDFLSSLPQYIDNINSWNPLPGDHLVEPQSIVQGITKSLSLKQTVHDLTISISNAKEGFVRLASLIFGGIFSFILIIVLSFYLAVQENGIANFLRIVTPLRHEHYIIDLWGRAQVKIGKWMQGQLMLGVVIGVLVFLCLTLLSVALPGIRNVFVFAVLAFVFELIPLFGPILASIPPILLAFTEGGITSGLSVTALYLVIHQFENHLIYPVVVRKIVGVPPILVILALIVGFKLGGFLGLLLSVPLATVLMEYIDDLQKMKKEARV